MDKNQLSLIEGIISIKACIESNNRAIDIVYIDKEKHAKRDRKITSFVSFLKTNQIHFEMITRDKIDAICQEYQGGNTHGGVIAFVSERKYYNFENFLDELLESNSYAVFLDGIEDPFNFGYSIRNMYAFGTFGFIIPERNWMSCANVVSRASAGASELALVSVAPDDKSVLNALKTRNINIVCAAVSKNSLPLPDFKPKAPFILFIGGEKRGISKEFIENADSVVHIPYKNSDAKFSLPAASAAAIFAHHLSHII